MIEFNEASLCPLITSFALAKLVVGKVSGAMDKPVDEKPPALTLGRYFSFLLLEYATLTSILFALCGAFEST